MLRKSPAALTKTLRSLRVHYPEETAGKLLALARGALSPDPTRIIAQQRSLATSVELYRCLENAAFDLRSESACLLASTPYVFLTSLPGIGFVLAAGVAGELGDPGKLAPLDSMCAYAGIVPATYQSGGPDSPARTGGTSGRCNHILKDWVVQSSQKLRQYGPPEWKERFVRWETGDQHALFAGARRYLRVLRTLVRRQIPYETPEARLRDATKAQRAASAEATWEALLKKWRTIPGWQEQAFGEGKPLTFWRGLTNSVHGTNLTLPKER